MLLRLRWPIGRVESDDSRVTVRLSACRCRCSSVRNVTGAWQFSGISLSRFVNYWRNHGKTAIPKLPNSGKAYFAAHPRLAQGLGAANAKRQRTSGLDQSRKQESNTADPVDSDTRVKATRSREPSEPSDVISPSRRELRKERATSATNEHGGAQQRHSESSKVDSTTGARRRRDTQHSAVPANGKPEGWRSAERAVNSRRTLLARGKSGFTCNSGVATKCIGRLHGKLRRSSRPSYSR